MWITEDLNMDADLDVQFEPWPISSLINHLRTGNFIDRLINNSATESPKGHNQKEYLLEIAFHEINMIKFGPDNSYCPEYDKRNVLKKRPTHIRDIIKISNTQFPANSKPDIVVEQNGMFHICEIKSNPSDKIRNYAESVNGGFKNYLEKMAT